MDARTDTDHLNEIAFEQAPIGIVMTEHRVIRTCNSAFADLFGYPISALIDRSFAMLYPSKDEFLRIRDRGVKALREDGRYSDERIMARKNGSHFWCRVRGKTLTSKGDPLAKAVWSFSDLSTERPVASQLSAREREVIMHLADGFTSKEMARLMNLSPRTVEAYRARLLKHYGCSNVAELFGKLNNIV